MQSSKISWQLWVVLCAVGTLIFLLNIDYTAVNLALVPVSEEIQADLSQLQWLLSAYVLVWAALVIPASRMADLVGKRRALMLGIGLFLAGSALTGAGSSLELLVSGRILQGIGAALFTAPAWSIIFTCAPAEKQGMVMGIVLSFAGFGLALGPTLGGLIIEHLSWRWIFYVNLPLGLLVIASLLLYAPKDAPFQGPLQLDWLGSFLLASSLFVTFYTLNQMEVWGSKSPKLWGLFAVGATLMGAYLWREKKSTDPMVPPHLFKNKPYMAAVLGEFFMAMTFAMVLVLMGLYLQNTLHYTSYETGLVFISMTLSMGVLSPVGGKLIDRFGVNSPMMLGCFLTAISFGMLAFLNKESSLVYVCSALFCAGTGLGIYFAACNTAMLQAAPAQDLNVASGVYSMAMMLGNTLSVILCTSLVVLWGREVLFQSLKEQGMLLTPEQHQVLVNLISKVEPSASALTGFAPQAVPGLLQNVNDAFVQGFSWSMMGGVLCSLLALGLTWWGVPRTHSKVETASLPPAH